jgi:hypothetical protein
MGGRPKRPGTESGTWLKAQQNPVLSDGVFATAGPEAKSALSLGDLSAFDAGCAHTQPFGGAIDQRLHRLQVHIPAPARHVVSVRNVIAELRTLAADITNLCHG